MNATAAAIAIADADDTLEFDPALLRSIYDRVSPYMVGLQSSPGYIAMSTSTHDLIAIHPELMDGIPESVTYYSTNTEVTVDAVARLSDDLAILFANRIGEPLPPITYSNLHQDDSVSEKVVTIFPCMETLSIFKGHTVVRHALSRRIGPKWAQDVEASSIGTFCFTCPYASSSFIDPKKNDLELRITRAMTLGAPVFNLSCEVVGSLCNVGSDYNVKYARNAAYLRQLMRRLWGEDVNWLKGEDLVRPVCQ
ncbi:unnamed protein product [Alopecurus aequalis]